MFSEKRQSLQRPFVSLQTTILFTVITLVSINRQIFKFCNQKVTLGINDLESNASMRETYNEHLNTKNTKTLKRLKTLLFTTVYS